MNKRVDYSFELLIAILLCFWLGNKIIDQHDVQVIPHCAEDVVLVGTGNFTNGTWDGYVCGPARDDYRG